MRHRILHDMVSAAIAACLLVCGASLCSDAVFGQKPKEAPNPKEQQAEPFSANGRLAAIAPGLLRVTAATGVVYDVKFMRQGDKSLTVGKGRSWNQVVTVKITGDISPDLLVARTPVRFTATIDEKGVPQGEVEELTVYTAGKNEQYGVFPNNESKSYSVKGIVSSLRRGTLTVDVPIKSTGAPRGKLIVKLSDGVRVLIESDDITLARIGDDIAIQGAKIATDVVATEITITKHAPFSAKKPSVSGGKKPGEKGKDDKAAPGGPNDEFEDGAAKNPGAPTRKQRSTPGKIVIVN